MALRTGTLEDAALPPIEAAAGRSAVSLPTEHDPLSAARGIFVAAVGGAAVWAAVIGGAVAVIQRLR